MWQRFGLCYKPRLRRRVSPQVASHKRRSAGLARPVLTKYSSRQPCDHQSDPTASFAAGERAARGAMPRILIGRGSTATEDVICRGITEHMSNDYQTCIRDGVLLPSTRQMRLVEHRARTLRLQQGRLPDIGSIEIDRRAV